MSYNLKITTCGVRGSVTTATMNNLRYGGNTTCTLLQAGSRCVLIDAGTGLVMAQHMLEAQGIHAFDLLLSHVHYDHIVGLCQFAPLFSTAYNIRILSAPRRDVHGVMQGTKEQVSTFFSAPYSPVALDAFRANLTYVDIQPNSTIETQVGLVQSIATNHPNGATGFKFFHKNKVFCNLVDHEILNPQNDPVIEFVANADLVLCDAQYLHTEYVASKVGWGHSSWENAIALANRAKVKKLVLSHHAPCRTDAMLDALTIKYDLEKYGCQVAREGETIIL